MPAKNPRLTGEAGSREGSLTPGSLPPSLSARTRPGPTSPWKPRPHSRAIAVSDAIALVAPLAVTLVAEGCVQAGCPQVAPREAQATLVHIRTAGIRPAGGEGHREPQALPNPQGAVTPTQRP